MTRRCIWWRVEYDHDPLVGAGRWCPPVVMDELVAVLRNEKGKAGGVGALEAATGKARWTFTAPDGGPFSPPVLAGSAGG